MTNKQHVELILKAIKELKKHKYGMDRRTYGERLTRLLLELYNVTDDYIKKEGT